MADDKHYQSHQGNAGERQQMATGKTPAMTTNFGVPLSDNQNSLKAGAADRRCWKTSSFVKKFSILTVGVTPSGSFMPAG